jgi:diguanylate cyclase (GGDEF)-like protein
MERFAHTFGVVHARPEQGHASQEPRTGTSVAIGFPLAALAALCAWLTLGPQQPLLPALGPVAALVLACAVYALFPLVRSQRSFMTFERPLLVLVGLVGGPVAGALGGIAIGLGDVEAVWRRRSTYAGLGMLEGIAAGFVGAAWRAGAISLVEAVALASALALAIGLGGFTIVGWVRRCLTRQVLGRALTLDAGELLVSTPLVYLLASSFSSAPVVTVLAAISWLVLVGAGMSALARQERRIEEIRRDQLRDLLTGALNRLGFEEAVAAAHARVLRGELPAAVLVIDLDSFRRFNEEHGHLGGDEALRHVTRRIVGALRPEDAVARWAGDELCVLSPRAGTLEVVERLAERVRAAVAGEPLSIEGQTCPVTISVGGTLLTEETSPDEAFDRADEALYLAKRRRNAVEILPPHRQDAHAARGLEMPAPRRATLGRA